MGADGGEPAGGDKAKVAGASHLGRPGDPVFGADRPQVDFLATEFQRDPPIGAEHLALQAEGALIPGGGRRDIAAVENDMVKAVDHGAAPR